MADLNVIGTSFPLPPDRIPPKPLPSPELEQIQIRDLGCKALYVANGSSCQGLGQSERIIVHLSQAQELSASTKDILERAGRLAQKFDIFIQQEEGKEINAEIVEKVRSLSEELLKLHSEYHSQCGSEAKLDLHTKISNELTKLTTRVEAVARDLESLEGATKLQYAIEQRSRAATLLLGYEINSGLKGANIGHALASYSALLDDLDSLLDFHDKQRLLGHQMHDDALRLQVITNLQESISQVAGTIERLHEGFHSLAADGTREDLEVFDSLLKRERLTNEKLRQHIDRHQPPVTQPQSLPHRFISGMSQVLRNPLRAAQDALSYIEEKSPLPSHFPPILKRQKETQISVDLHRLRNIISGTEGLARGMQERLDHLPVTSDKEKGKLTVSVTYSEWLDDLVKMHQRFDELQHALEGKQQPEPSDLEQVQGFIKGIEDLRRTFQEMRPKLVEAGLRQDIRDRLEGDLDAAADEAESLWDILEFRTQINVQQRKANDALEKATTQGIGLAKGDGSFNVDHDAKVLQQLNVLGALYRRTAREGLPKEYHFEMLELLAAEVKSLTAVRGMYMSDYRDAMEARVAETSLQLDRHHSTSTTDDLRSCTAAVMYARKLISETAEAHRRLGAYQRQLIRITKPLLGDASASTDNRSALHKEFKRALAELQDDVAFLEEQLEVLREHPTITQSQQRVIDYLSSLSAEEAEALVPESVDLSSLGWRGLFDSRVWTVRRRNAHVERRLRHLTEPEEKEEGLGMKVLRFGLWALYFSNNIHATAQFISHAHEYWSTGENPLKPYADLLSHAAFARQAADMPAVDQARVGMEMNLVEGIIKGFIPYTLDMVEHYPDLADFLLEQFNISAPVATGLQLTDAASAGLTPDARDLTSQELNQHLTHFLGQQVQKHYESADRQLAWTHPQGTNIASLGELFSPIPIAKAPPTDPLQVIGSDLVNVIKYHREGHPISENLPLQQLQQTVTSLFGMPLPMEWVEGWLFKQEWSDQRLEDFSTWTAQSLAAQASYHLSQQQVREPEPQPETMPLPSPLLLGSTQSGSVLQQSAKVTTLENSDSRVIATASSVALEIPSITGFLNQQASYFNASPPTVVVVNEPVRPSSLLTNSALIPLLKADQGSRRLHYFLLTNRRPVDEKMLAHLIGHSTAAISGTEVDRVELEGYRFDDTIGYLLGIAESMLESVGSYPPASDEEQDLCCKAILLDPLPATDIRSNPETLKTIVDQLRIAEDLIVPWSSSPADFEAYHHKLIDKISTLEPGESFFLSSGWIGHATVFEIILQDDGDLTIRHYNTGHGIDRHAKATIELQQRFLHFYELLNVSPDRFTSRAFHYGIWLINTSEGRGGVETMYEVLIPGLGGEISSKQYSKDELKAPQYVGICAMESIMTAIEHSLTDSPSVNLFRFWSTLKATTSYFDESKESLVEGRENEERRRLFDDSLRALSARAQTVAREGSITSHELALVNVLLDEMRKELSLAETVVVERYVNELPLTTFEIPNQPPKTPEIGELTYRPNDIVLAPPPTPALRLPLNWNEWTPIPQLLSHDLAQCLDQVRSINSPENYYNVQSTIKQITMKIPLNDEAFWKQIDTDSAAEVLSMLTELNQEFYKSFVRSGKQRKANFGTMVHLSSNDFFAQIKLLSLTDLLIHRFDNPLSLRLPSLFQKSMLGILSPVNRTDFVRKSYEHNEWQHRAGPTSDQVEYYRAIPNDATSEWQDELIELRHYWNSQAIATDGKDLFGFNILSAGSSKSYTVGYLILPEEIDSHDSKNLLQLLSEEEFKLFCENHRIDLTYSQQSHGRWFEVLERWVIEHPELVEEINPELKNFPSTYQVYQLFGQMRKIPVLYSAFVASYSYSNLLTGNMNTDTSEFTSIDLIFGKRSDWSTRFQRSALIGDFSITGGGRILYDATLSFSSDPIDVSTGRENDKCDLADRPALALLRDRKQALGPVLSRLYSFSEETISSKKYFERFSFSERDNYNEKYLDGRLRAYGTDFLGERVRLDPNLIVLLDPSLDTGKLPLITKMDISVEELRNLLNLSSVKELQIAQVLGYFSLNHKKLFKRDYQQLFHLLITEERLLEDWLIKDPEAGNRLALLCQEIQSMAHHISDSGTETFIAGMSWRIADTYRRAASKHVELFADIVSPSFLPSRDILRNLLRRTDLSDTQIAVAARELALTYSIQDDLTSQEATDLLKAIRLADINSNDPSGRRREPIWALQVMHLMQDKFFARINQLLESPAGHSVLNSLRRIATPEATEISWRSLGFPYYISEDGIFVFDALHGSLIDQRGGLEPFRGGFLDSDIIREIVGNSPPKYATRADNIILFEDSRGNSYRIFPDEPPRIQRNFDGRWYELQDREFALSPGIVEGRHSWYSGPTSEHNEPEILVVDPATAKSIYRVTLSSGRGRVQQLDDQGVPNGLEMLNPNLPELRAFSRFESTNYLLPWARDGILEVVSMPRYGIEFELVVNNEGHREAICNQYPGYSLVEGKKQYIALLGDFDTYLLLQRKESDGTNKEMVVLSTSSDYDSSRGNYSTLWRRNQGQIDRFEFTMQEGRLIPATANTDKAIEANLYLAYIYLHQKDEPPVSIQADSRYSKVKRKLEELDQQMLQRRTGLTEEAKDRLEQLTPYTILFNGDIVIVDHHPDAIALGVKAAYLQLRDNLDFRGSGTPTALHLYYTEYLTHLDHMDRALLLTPQEERLILTQLLPTSQMVNRLNDLTQEPGTFGRELVATEAVSMPSPWRRLPSLKDLAKAFTERSEVVEPRYPLQINASGMLTEYYAIAKGEISVSEAVDILNRGMGLSLSNSLSIEEVRQELMMALRMSYSSLVHLWNDEQLEQWRLDTKSQYSAAILLTVATFPERFPSSEYLSNWAVSCQETGSEIAKLSRAIQGLNEEVGGIDWAIKLKPSWLPADYISRSAEMHQQIATLEDELKSRSSDNKDLIKQFEKQIIKPVNELIASVTEGLTRPPSKNKVEESSRLREARKLAATRPLPPPEDLTFAQCIELRAVPYSTPCTLSEAIIPDEALQQTFLIRPRKPIEGVAAHPETLFAVDAKNSNITNVFREAGSSFVEYVESGKGVRNEYDIIAREKLDIVQDTLSGTIGLLTEKLRYNEDALLQLANREYEDLGKRSEVRLGLHRGTEKLINLQELVRCLYQRDYNYLHQRNPALSEDNITEFFALIQDFLLDATHLIQQRRVLASASQLSTSIVTGAGDIEIQENIRAFLNAAKTVRYYDFREHPEYLVFEYFTETLLWQSQVETLSVMNKSERAGALIELAMGQGKSHVIIPLQAWLNADGERLAAIVMPEPLIDEMGKELSKKFGTVFGQKIRSIPIVRAPITFDRMNRLYQRLCEVRDNREVILWTPSDIQSLFNQWIELLETALDDEKAGLELSSETEELNAVFVKIFTLLGDSGVLTIDEAHRVFDILTSHKFTFGAPERVHHDIAAATNHLFGVIVSPQIQSKLRWEFLADSSGPAFNEQRYHDEVKSDIIDTLLEQHIDPSDRDFKAFFNGLSKEQRQLIREYLLDKPVDTPTIKVEGVQEQQQSSWTLLGLIREYIPGQIIVPSEPSSSVVTPYQYLSSLEGETGKKVRNQLAVLKELLGVILPITSSKKPLVHYGQDGEDTITIPYYDGRPTLRTLFGSILERLLYTTQYALAKGLPESIIRREIAALQEGYREAVLAGKGIEEILLRFLELCGHDSNFGLMDVQEDDYAKITKIVNDNPKMQLILIQRYRIPEIKVYGREIQSSAHIFPALSRKERGLEAMSGTIPNYPTFPQVFQEPKLSDTQVKTLEVLRRNSPQDVITMSATGSTAGEKVAGIYDGAKSPPGCVLDGSGDTLGIGNEQLAREMLIRLPVSIEGVVYYDGDTLKVIFRKELNPQLYSRSLDKTKLAALWDLPHTVGSDIPMGDFMTATMLVSKHTTLVDMMQTAWRMRGLAKGQTINFMVPKEDRDYIAGMLKEHLNEAIDEDANLTLDQLFRYQLLIQTLKESGNNYRAIQERMKMALTWRLVEIMWDQQMSFRDTFEIFREVRSLFVSETPKEPWDIWGAPIEQIPTVDALEALLKSWKESPIIAAIRAKPALYRGLKVDELFAAWEGIIHGPKGPLPETIATAQTYGQTTQQATESEEESQQMSQQQAQAQSQQQTEQRTVTELGLNKLPKLERLPPVHTIFDPRESKPSPIVWVRWKVPSIDSQTGRCITANHMLSSNSGLRYCAGIFDDSLVVSLNIAPVHTIKDSNARYQAFDKTQKDCTFVQIVQYSDRRIVVKMLDPDDAADVNRQIEEAKNQPERDIKVGLMQIQQTGLSMITTQAGIDVSDSSIRERIQELLAQAKFLAGEIKLYSDEEFVLLHKWLLKIGPEIGFRLFKSILNPDTRPDSREAFSSSKLASLFRELGVNTDLI